jgi:hypothetical protein
MRNVTVAVPDVETGDVIVFGANTFTVTGRKLGVNGGVVFIDAANNVFIVPQSIANVVIQIT